MNKAKYSVLLPSMIWATYELAAAFLQKGANLTYEGITIVVGNSDIERQNAATTAVREHRKIMVQ